MNLTSEAADKAGKSKTCVLIVDDDQQFNALLAEIFRGVGYQVRTADSAGDGLEVLAREPVDLVITDQRMPGMLGVAFIERIRAELGAKPVIMVSGYLDSETLERLEALEVNAIFSKPMNIGELLNAAERAVARSRDHQTGTNVFQPSQSVV
jgi:DNA-binding response OmpR family regulator